MNPTKEDLQIFDEMKQTFLGLDLSITGEGQRDNYLFFTSRFFKNTPDSENDMSIGYQIKARMIRVTLRLPLLAPVPAVKQGDFFEVFNYINHKLAHVRVNIDPATGQIEYRGEMPVFGNQLNRDHLKAIISYVLMVGMMYSKKLYNLLKGSLKKENIINHIDAEIKSQMQDIGTD